jgi:hypothetical protein
MAWGLPDRQQSANFPEQWLIVSLIYPPKRLQQSLL